ncbi:polysaccharide deacetylase family protein [Yinghuangia aomiensis]
MQHALDAIAKASPGTPVPFYRAPGGGWSPLVQETAASLGMRSLGWSVDTEDWKKPGVDKAMATVSKQLGNSGTHPHARRRRRPEDERRAAEEAGPAAHRGGLPVHHPGLTPSGRSAAPADRHPPGVACPACTQSAVI